MKSETQKQFLPHTQVGENWMETMTMATATKEWEWNEKEYDASLSMLIMILPSGKTYFKRIEHNI